MQFPRLPDWTVYIAVVAVLVVVSLGRRENADTATRPANEAPNEVEGALLGPVTLFDPMVSVNNPDTPYQPSSGTAFSIAGDGRWITARHVVEGCRRPALVVGDRRAVGANVRLAEKADIALMMTEGGPTALPVTADRPLRLGQRAFHPGFPQGEPGEITTRLLGREILRVRGRGARDEPVLVWAEVGRSRGLEGTLAGLSGAPAIDSRGRAIGVTIAESPRRGRVYTTAPETYGPAIRGEQRPDERVLAQDITTDNYGKVSEQLRRDLRVAQVVCLSV
jgi:S1-C subfamily serine protease